MTNFQLTFVKVAARLNVLVSWYFVGFALLTIQPTFTSHQCT